MTSYRVYPLHTGNGFQEDEDFAASFYKEVVTNECKNSNEVREDNTLCQKKTIQV